MPEKVPTSMQAYMLNIKHHSNTTTITIILIFILSALVSAASFISRLFIELYAVIIGSSALAISIITSSRNLIQLSFQSAFGRISDRLGRKKLMVGGLIISGISLGLFPLIQNQWVLVGGVFFFSVGFASYYPSFTALQGDLTSKENRASFISLITLIGAFGTITSLLITGAIGARGETELEQYSIILRVIAGLFIFTAIIALLFDEPETQKLKDKQVFSFMPFRKNRGYRKFIIINCFMFFSMSMGWPIYGFVRAVYATAQENTYIWAVFSGCQIITLLIVQKTIDKIPRTKLLFFGRVFMFFIPLNLALTVLWFPYWWQIALGSGVSGISNALFLVSQNSYLLDLAPEDKKGTYMGLFNFFIGIATFFGSLLMGMIADLLFIYFDKWSVIVVLLFVVTSARFLSSLGYLTIKPSRSEEKEGEEEWKKEDKT